MKKNISITKILISLIIVFIGLSLNMVELAAKPGLPSLTKTTYESNGDGTHDVIEKVGDFERILAGIDCSYGKKTPGMDTVAHYYVQKCSYCSFEKKTGWTRHTYSDGKCTECDYVCKHPEWTQNANGEMECGRCGTLCAHNWGAADGHTKCKTCGFIKHMYAISGSTHKCYVAGCGYLYNEGKAVSVNGVTVPYDTHIYSGLNCKICGKDIGIQSNEFSTKLTSWGGYKPYDEGNVTFTGGTLRIVVDGVFEKAPSQLTAYYSHYYPQNASWHQQAKEELGEGFNYTAHLEYKGKIGGGGSVTGTIAGNTITFSGFPTSGGPYRVSCVNGTSGFTFGMMRYTTPGASRAPADGTYVTVKHVNDTTGTELKSESIKVEKGDNSGPYNRITDEGLKAYGNNMQYENKIEKIIGSNTETQTGETISLTNITQSVTIIFHYSQYAQVKVVGRINESPYSLLYEEDIEKINLTNSGKAKSYDAKELGGFKCVGYKVEDTLESDLENITNNTSTGKKASVTVNVSNPVKLITFLYEIDGIAFSITHIDETTGELMAKNPNTEAETSYTGSLGYLLSQYVDLSEKPEILEAYTNLMKSGKSDAEKAAEVMKILEENWSAIQNNLIMLKSLNIYSDFYNGYINKGFEVEGVKVSTTQTQAADGTNTIKQTERYIPELAGIVSALESGISITDGVVNLVFKYSKGNLLVKHIQVGPSKNATGEFEQKLLEESTRVLETVNAIEVPSLNLSGAYEGMLNWDATLDGNQVMDENKKFEKTSYTVSVTPTGSSREVIFYYIKPEVEIAHIYLDKEDNEISRTESTEPLDKKKDIGSNPVSGQDYVNKEVKVDGEIKKKIGEGLKFKVQYSVEVEPIGPGNRRVEFYYNYQPILVWKEEDIKYRPVTCDPKIDKEAVEVDSEITLTIPNYGYHIDFGESNYYNYGYAYKKLVKFPFEVYYDETLYAANTWIEVADRNKIIDEEESDGTYKFRIPAWTEEKYKNNEKYEIDVRVTCADSYTEAYAREQSNDVLKNGEIAYGKVSLKVVGKIYDFSVTNLENDATWQAGLFGGTKVGHEYKADELPIGQANTVQSAYKYGMKLGSTFLFSVNTLGIKNEKIKILPKVYFVEKEGGNAVDVTNAITFETSKGKVNYATDTSIMLSTKINKATRMTIKVQQEVKKAMEMRTALSDSTYGQNTNNDSPFGNYNKLLITKTLRLPYYEFIYGNDTESIARKQVYVGKENKALSAASHWYAEYKLPSTTKYMVNNKVKEGFFIVCFKISSLYASGNEYLVYENQIVSKNQWKNENGDKNPVEIKLPSAYGLTGKTTKIDISNGYYPVAIYQSNISVNNNYEVGGTH